ncbi:peptidase S8 [Salicibibacter halophilus]|uniref:Peptidase S8 n=1 Tax=Salicibibacter halophilus TaxID=2502791 RepID=A0A514LII6_9BACI|nr:S8 family serine peptidase [Salicibibacter halophilus]QDI91660.1 peptidase S8 [Salicibibacter halophilus]
MKKCGYSFIMFMLILSVPAGMYANEPDWGGANSSEGSDHIDGELVISIEREDSQQMGIQDTNDQMHASDLEDQGFEVTDSLLDVHDQDAMQALDSGFVEQTIENMGMVYLTTYSADDFESVEDAKNELEETVSDLGLTVRDITENYEMQTLEEPSTSQHPNQEWHYEMINALDAWDVNPGSSDVTQAVLDTGIDHNHESLSDYVDTDLGESFVGDGTTMDEQGHGTHVAGTIASYGEVSGVMQEATLIPVKVLGDDGTGSMFNIIEGVLYAAENDADVINMSLGGGGYNQSFDEAAQTATDEGSVVIAASGNEGIGSIDYPAAYESVIAVGSVDEDETRSAFSSYGDGLELMAPGSNIYSTVPGNGYQEFSGTSMAAPHVAGVAGLMRAVDADLPVSDVRAIMNDTARDAGNVDEYGNGIVDALAAVEAAGGDTPPDPDPDPDGEKETSVATNYDVYFRGENVDINANVTDNDGNTLPEADVDFTVTRPDGTTMTQTESTNDDGEASWTVGTDMFTPTGIYQVEANTTLSGYEDSSGSTEFEVY